MNIQILTVGKLKEKYLGDAVAEYKKRLSRFCKISITELTDVKIPDRASLKEQEMVLKKEGDAILASISASAYVVALCIEGGQLSSQAFAETLSRLAIDGKSDICFIIGGSLGLSNEVKSRANMQLSFSKMTFPLQLMRVILFEQIYRCFKILEGSAYH